MCYPARCSVMATPTFLFYCRQISFFYSLPYLLPHDGALTSAFDVSLYPLILLPLSMAAFYTLEVNSQPLFHHPLPTETSSTNIVPLLFPFSFLYMFTSSHCSKYRHIVSTLTSAISYASVSHMLLPVRHTLVTPPPTHTHTHMFCVCLFSILLPRLRAHCWTETSFSTCYHVKIYIPCITMQKIILPNSSSNKMRKH